MKTLLAAVLLLATTLVAVPGATAACVVDDPTGTTDTCVEHLQGSSGDCEGGDGSHYDWVRASTYTGSQYVRGWVWNACVADPEYGNDYENRGFEVLVWEMDSGTTVAAGFGQITGTTEYCAVYVHHNIGDWQREEVHC